MEWWVGLLIGVACLILGGILGFFIARWYFQNEMEKNPPINEDMIRAMFQSMGRPASEKQIRQVMASVNAKKNKK